MKLLFIFLHMLVLHTMYTLRLQYFVHTLLGYLPRSCQAALTDDVLSPTSTVIHFFRKLVKHFKGINTRFVTQLYYLFKFPVVSLEKIA